MSDRVQIPSPFYRVSVKALVFDREGRLLVVQAEDGFWEVPGGGWEHGETIEEALRRELREELGAELRHADFSAIRACAGPGPGGDFYRLKLAVRAELEDGEITLGDGMQAWRYVSHEEFVALPTLYDRELQPEAGALWALC